MRRRILLIVLITAFIFPSVLKAQANWTCDGGPNDIMNAAEAAQNSGNLQKALELAKLAIEICKDNPVRQGQAQLLVADITQELTPTATPEPDGVDFPDLTGSYKVGRIAYEWIDSSRAETFGPDKSAKRNIVVWVWYPATVTSASKKGIYVGDDWWNAIYQGSPGLNRYVRTHAYAGVPVSSQASSYPILIFDPGLLDVPFNYTSIAEELASHGYIFVGLTHPYSSAAVAYFDGRVVITSKAGQDVNPTLLGVWTADVRFVLEQRGKLNKADSNDRFSGRMDFTRVGMLGHSFGGVNTIQTTFLDNRIKAGVILSGADSTLAGAVDLQKPFMVVGGEGAGAFFNTHLHGDKYSLYVSGISNLDFGDWGLLPPLVPGPPDLGTIDPREALRIINGFSVAFFEKYFNNGSVWPSYSEAVFTSIPAAAPTATGS